MTFVQQLIVEVLLPFIPEVYKEEWLTHAMFIDYQPNGMALQVTSDGRILHNENWHWTFTTLEKALERLKSNP